MKTFESMKIASDEIRELNAQSENLTKFNEESFQQLRKSGGNSLNLEDEHYLRLEEVEEGYIERIDNLQQHIQDMSRKKVVER